MSVDTSDLSRVTIDYLFRNRENVKSMMLFADEPAMAAIVDECESRGINAVDLFLEAIAEQKQKLAAWMDGRAVYGGSEIRVPLQYKVKGN